MCARFRSPKDLERLKARFGFAPLFNFPFNPNLAPTEGTPILRTSDGSPVWEMARFGLVPFWAKSLKGQPSLHNARAETVKEKPAFKQSYAKRRCIIPAEGFYEWREENGKKMPYYFSRKDGELICFAGIWEFAEIENEKIFSFAMLTGEPNDLTRPYHDRMPLITDDVGQWLDLKQDSLASFNAIPVDHLEITPKNPAMNKANVKDLAQIDA